MTQKKLITIAATFKVDIDAPVAMAMIDEFVADFAKRHIPPLKVMDVKIESEALPGDDLDE